MSPRYPTGLRSAMFPNSVEMSSPGSRNIYGEVATDGAKTTMKARIAPTTIEVIEAGVKVQRRGIKITVPSNPGMSIDVGTLVDWGDERWSIIYVTGRLDHSGNQNCLILEAVLKAGERI